MVNYKIEKDMKRKVFLFLSWMILVALSTQAAAEGTVDFFKGQIATIVLPIKPDASKGRYFKLARVEYGRIIFEEVLQPKARTPYVIVPNQDFSIDPDTLDLAGLGTEIVKREDLVGFVGTYAPRNVGLREASFNYLLDSTPDCYYEDNFDLHVGPLRAFVWVNHRARNCWKDKMKMEYILYTDDEEILTTFNKDQMATIILPQAPDTSLGKYYRLDRYEGNDIIFEQETAPKAHVPYIIVPSRNYCFDASTMDLEGCYRDTVSVGDVKFIGSFVSDVIISDIGYNTKLIDITPDCIAFGDMGGPAAGPLRAYLEAKWDAFEYDVRFANIVLKDKGTGIEELKNEELRMKNDEAIYDLQGRRLPRKPTHGIYIENGKKRAR